MSIIEAKGVSIRYMTGDFKDIGLKEYVVRRLSGKYHVNEFWADKNVSFALEKGDMLGIIGSNGAGKSTLLKAVSGIMVPTEGHMEINGSVAALLELASGFRWRADCPREHLPARRASGLYPQIHGRKSMMRSSNLRSCRIFRTARSNSCPAA